MTSSASSTTAPSTQPPETEPRKCPSSSIARCEPTGRGAEPQVSTTVAIATGNPAAFHSCFMEDVVFRREHGTTPKPQPEHQGRQGTLGVLYHNTERRAQAHTPSLSVKAPALVAAALAATLRADEESGHRRDRSSAGIHKLEPKKTPDATSGVSNLSSAFRQRCRAKPPNQFARSVRPIVS